MRRARIIAIGDELLNGAVVDTNSQAIIVALEPFGFEVDSVRLVRDRTNEIVEALRNSLSEADIVFTIGGLGPTTDDLTRESIAELLNVKLVEHKRARAKLEEFFKRRARTISENNYRQIVFPEGSEILSNDVGTADAFVSPSNPPIVSLPGVPRELRWILENRLAPWLEGFYGIDEHPPERRYLRFFGVSESFLGREIESLNLPPTISVAYRPVFPEILITLSAEPSVSAVEIDRFKAAIASKIGAEFVTSEDNKAGLPEILAEMLNDKGIKIAAAESCTGGLIADLFTSIPGASNFFLASAVTYSNQSKTTLADVDAKIIASHGAVSEETAVAMARGMRVRAAADVGLSVTGIAGPDGGTEEKPIGTFFVGLSTPAGDIAQRFYAPNERNMFRRYAAYTAIDLVRRGLKNLPLKWERR